MCDAVNQCIVYEFDDWWSESRSVVSDLSDEENCSNWTCSEGLWKCQESNICILKGQVCDGKDDCFEFSETDNSDEVNCNNNSTCQLGSQTSNCVEHNCFDSFLPCNGSCIDERNICNGVTHRPDGKDEQCCSDVTCDHYSWKCETKKQCVFSFKLCDGYSDCLDNSDEKCRSHEGQTF